MGSWGWAWRVAVLGTKREECGSCGRIGVHVLARRARWGRLCRIPLVPVGVQVGMLCVACGQWTAIGWRSMRRGTRKGRLPLLRSRPVFEAAAAELELETGHRPTPAEALDRVTVNR